MQTYEKYYIMAGQLQPAKERNVFVESISGIISSVGIDKQCRNYVIKLLVDGTKIVEIATFANRPDAESLRNFGLENHIGQSICLTSSNGQIGCRIVPDFNPDSPEEIADAIYNEMSDYSPIIRDGWQLSRESILDWANQFDDDALFMLRETLNIVRKVYLSEAQAKQILREKAKEYFAQFNNDWKDMCKNVLFLQLQMDEHGPRMDKSQCILVGMIRDIILEESGFDILDVNTFPEEQKSVFVYLDDVLASGKTYREDVTSWLKGENNKNLNRVLNNEITLDTFYFCSHSIQQSNAFWSIACNFSEDNNKRKELSKKIEDHFEYHYLIDNGRKVGKSTTFENNKLNNIFPRKLKYVDDYLKNYNNRYQCENKENEDVKYRPDNCPDNNEILFSSPENRDRYEELIFTKSTEILHSYQNPGIWFKPLGLTNESDRSLGLGTLFITWRNIPNNCPLAFWCVGNGGMWKALCRRSNTR